MSKLGRSLLTTVLLLVLALTFSANTEAASTYETSDGLAAEEAQAQIEKHLLAGQTLTADVLNPVFNDYEKGGIATEQSRSLQKKGKRKIIESYFDRLLGFNRVYFAFSEASESGEAMVFNANSKPPRYDFFVVKKLKGANQVKLEPASRSLCISCHQNGGPIFTPEPWSEFSAIASPQSGAVNSFDSSTRKAAKVLQLAGICHSLCENKVPECQPLFEKFKNSAERNDLKTMSAAEWKTLLSFWPEKGFEYPSSVLLDRKRSENETERFGLKSFKRSDPNEDLSFSEEHSRLARAGVEDEVTVVASIKMNMADTLALADPQHTRTPQGRITKDNAKSFLEKNLAQCKLLEGSKPEIKIGQHSQKVAAPFNKNCLRCHQPGDEPNIPFQDLQKLRDYPPQSEHYKGKTVLQLIESQEMPPPKSPEGKNMSEADRLELKKLLKEKLETEQEAKLHPSAARP